MMCLAQDVMVTLTYKRHTLYDVRNGYTNR